MKYNPQSRTLAVSVRALIETACKSGSIDTRHGGIFVRASDGSHAHKKLQKRYGENCEAEVPLSTSLMYEGILYEISGRADGIIYGPDGCTVDEIKTVRFPPALVDDDFARPHLAQAVCYAYMLCEARMLESALVQLTYYNYELDQIHYIVKRYAKAELQSRFEQIIATYHSFANYEILRREDRLPSIQKGRFPYAEVREGQHDFITEGYRAIKSRSRLLVQAPTGIGKTISGLYPAIKAIGHGHADKIFYLTAKGTGRLAAFDTARKLCESGFPLHFVILYAREMLCLIGKGSGDFCNPVDCPYAKGHYDRVGAATRDLLDSGISGYDFEVIKQYALKFNVCPYELSLDISEYCDLLIGDCNYLFDPQVYLRRFFDPKWVSERSRESLQNQGYIFLIDEAHNLLDRTRNMYSGRLYRKMFAPLAEEIGISDHALSSAISRVAIIMEKMRRLCADNLYTYSSGDEYGYYVSKKPINAFIQAITDLVPVIESRLPHYSGTGLFTKLRNLFFELREYINKMSFFSDCFVTLVEIKRGDVYARILCLDPCPILDARMSCARSSILFSATLTPIDYFSSMLGGEKGASVLDLPSPFDPERLCIAVMDKISTRQMDREVNAKATAEIISATVSAKKGNYMVYLPSYQFLSIIHDAFVELCPDINTVKQQRGGTQAQRAAFLDMFSAERTETLVGFCVLGGLYAEGIDLAGERLIGTIIIGTGIPQLSLERNLLRAYYDESIEAGFEYAYIYPGISRVLQAAGRVIRSEEDFGIVVLIDDRFATPQYRQLFPPHWRSLKYIGNIRSLEVVLDRFWSSI